MNREQLKKELLVDEAFRGKPYRDSLGFLSIGIGRNLDANGIRIEEALFMLDNDIKQVERDLDAKVAWWRQLTDNRQRALANMAFNLGITKLLGFKSTLAHLEAGRYGDAAEGVLQSLYAKQVGNRARRIADLIREG